MPDPITTPTLDGLPARYQWRGAGPAPAYWYAKDEAGNTVKVYRSYQDYCDG